MESKHFVLIVHMVVPEHHKPNANIIPVSAASYIAVMSARACDRRTIPHHTVSYRATSWGILNLLFCGRPTPTLKTFISSQEDHKKP